MKLSELKKGQKVTIRCKSSTFMVDMDAYVAGIRAEVVLLELIRHEGQVVDFSSQSIQLIAIYEDGKDMPKAWINCRIQRRTLNGKQYHALAAPKASVRVNRRKVSRLILNLPGKLRISNAREGIDITVCNLCADGIGFKSMKKVEEQELKHLYIEFTDEDLSEDEDIDIKVDARVVWKKEMEKEGGFYYGCRLTNAQENLGFYIINKMRDDKQ